MKIAVKVKLKVQKEDESRLFQTLSAYKIAWQIVSDWSFSNDLNASRKLANRATYNLARKKLPDLPSGLIQAAGTNALAKIKSVKSNSHKLTKAPQIKNVSLNYDPRTYTVKGETMSLSVCGGKRIKVGFQDYLRFNDFRAKYKMLSPIVSYSKGVFWATFIFDVPDILPVNKSVVGLDLGQRNFVATSEGKIYKCKDLNRLRRKIRFFKRSLQKRGTKSDRRTLRKIRLKEQRQSSNAIHCLTKKVLSDTKADYLAVEKLKLPTAKGYGRKGKNRRKNSVPLSKFTQILSYKSKRFGKEVVAVNPWMTSQDDCRGLDSGERIGGKYVGIDGKILNADINAACNIAWKAALRHGLNNPLVPKGYERQVEVTQPIAFKSSVQNGSLARCPYL